MRVSKLFVLGAGCFLILAFFLAEGCSDDDKSNNPTIPTTLEGSWAPLGTGIGVNPGAQVFALTTYDTKLIMGGDFTSVDSVTANGIAVWNGASWTPFGGGVTGGPVKAFTTWMSYLVAGGGFDQSDGSSADHVALWDGSSWGGISPGRAQEVYTLAVFMDALCAGGDNGTGGGLAFLTFGGWTEMATDITVSAFAIYDNDLIIGGTFDDVGGGSYNNIFAFTGSDGLSLGSGVGGPVYALTVYNGTLIAGGFFSSAGGVGVHNIAAWNDSTWSPLGGGVDGTVYGLTVFNNKLIAAGSFTTAGGISANYIAAWDGSSWKALGSGMDGTVRAVTSYDNKVIAGGDFNTAGGESAPGIAAWTPK
jgi:hypothetical protein